MYFAFMVAGPILGSVKFCVSGGYIFITLMTPADDHVCLVRIMLVGNLTRMQVKEKWTCGI